MRGICWRLPLCLNLINYFAISFEKCCFKDMLLPHQSHLLKNILQDCVHISKTNPDNMTERESSRKPRKCDKLLFLCWVFCFCTGLFCVSTDWPSLPIWITVTFSQQTVESLWNLSAISSHKAISKATNTELLSKHITEEACIAVACVQVPSQAAFSIGMLYMCCRGLQS